MVWPIFLKKASVEVTTFILYKICSNFYKMFLFVFLALVSFYVPVQKLLLLFLGIKYVLSGSNMYPIPNMLLQPTRCRYPKIQS